MEDKYGPLPEMKWVPLDQLRSNDSYQRGISSRASQKIIAKIKSGFDWSKFQAPTLTPLKEGGYAIIDGQHRVEAVRMLGDVKEIPAYIVQTDFTLEQAESFISINRDRVQMHTIQLFHARVAAAEAQALRVSVIAKETGVDIPRSPVQPQSMRPEQTHAVGSLEKIYAWYGESVLRRTLKLLRTAYEDTEGQLTGMNIRMIGNFIGKWKDLIDDDRMLDLLLDIDLEDVREMAIIHRKTHGGNAPAAQGEVLLSLYNKAVPALQRLQEG